MKYGLFVFVLTLIPTMSNAKTIAFSDGAWDIEAVESRIEVLDGQEALFVKNGRAMLNNVVFQNGTIEFDMMGDGSRGFSGVYWRMSDPGNGENFYIRPHQSGKEDANQYQPIFNGLGGWQMYFGPSYSTPLAFKANQWTHIKVVVSGSKADIYVDSDKPVLHINKLKHQNIAGAIGVGSGFAPAYFANFSFEKNDNPEIVGQPVEMKASPEGVISSWQVSQSFAETELVGHSLSVPTVTQGKWHKLEVEDWGFANLSRIQAISNEANTALAKVSISTDKATTKNITFGYSDRVKVYLNNKLLYTGNNNYRSRDYRFLGTIGLFDEVPLHLTSGQNELVFAVSESFGGWAVMATMTDREGVVIND